MASAPSPRTRQAFREYLVGTYLRYITDVFTAAGLQPAAVPDHVQVGGERRYRVEEFYAGVDWSSATAVRQVLDAYEHILYDADEEGAGRLARALERDGYLVAENGRISPPPSLGIDSALLVTGGGFEQYERRILDNIIDDPELAIGSSKELVEAVCRVLLGDAGLTPDPDWGIEKLFKESAKTLDLSVEGVDDGRAGADSIRKVLRALAQTVVGTAELRNRYGTGHGRASRPSGLGPRHARLVASAAIALSRFMLDTRAERAPSTRSG